eukprot:s4197_g4.t1
MEEDAEEEKDFEEDEVVTENEQEQASETTAGTPAESSEAPKNHETSASNITKGASNEPLPETVVLKRQKEASNFFGQVLQPWLSEPNMGLDEEPALPPKKKVHRIEDAVKAMLQQGIVTKDGQVIRVQDKDVAEVASEVREKMLDEKEKFKRGGRPTKLVGKRGVAGGLKSNMKLKGQKCL